MTSRYHQSVDPDAPNTAHAYALELIGHNRRVLELGAASGHVTEALVARRCSVTAIEFDSDAAAGLEAYAEQVLVRDLNDPDVFADVEPGFDIVLAGDVLEHLLRPHDVLGRAVHLLRTGGRVVVSVPHVGHVDVRLSLLQGEWNYGPWGLLDDTHTRFFTLPAIEQMVREAGLVITDLRRVRIPAFETELTVDRALVPTEALELALADPEAETYQFVFSATVDDGDYRTRRMAARTLEVEHELQRTRIGYGVLDVERRRLSEEYTRLLDAHTQLREDARVNQKTLLRVDGSVVWQTFQVVRRWLFARLGGEHSVGVRALQAILRAFGRAVLGTH